MSGSVTVENLTSWVENFASLIASNKSYLTDLDSAIGDADHGVNMDRGMKAVRHNLTDFTPVTADELFKQVAMTLISSVGGASGPLYGTFFLRLGIACGARKEICAEDLLQAIHAGVEGLVSRGRPELGDKTMYDAFAPAMDSLDRALRAGESVGQAFNDAWQSAVVGRDETIAMVAKKGRASYLGERSVGHQDPGATSAALLFEAAALSFGRADEIGPGREVS
ncbi:MAG: dihydroxyacetone kinase subunit DhaL [Ferrimicrobium sp.]